MSPIDPSDAHTGHRSAELFRAQWERNAARTDRMFAVLMVLQWLAAIIVSLALSPKTWNGFESQTHPHVWLSLLLGGVLASLPVGLAWLRPGRALTRHVIAVAQVLFSSLLIHVSGGRIETHFHVFGSLAFLAFYRDWTVLVPATVLVAVDHFVRGVLWPETVFGVATVSPWRWVEHAAWVLYEDVFLVMSCRSGVREMWSNAVRTAELERSNRDIQQRTEELEQAYRAKNAVVETALDAVIGMDREGRITGWNTQAEVTFGWTAAEAVGRALADTIIPERFRAHHTSSLQRYLETGESRVLNRRIEVAALHRDGGEFPVEIAVSPLRSGDSVSFCAFVRDITERLRHAESLQSAKEAAEAASRAKSAFLAHMSHEIRTPLNGILGFAELLLSSPDGDARERHEHVKTIHDSGRHLLSLVNDVLDLSKVESGQMEVERVQCSPHAIIAEVLSILRVRAQERGLSLECFWKGEIPETIESDPARLRQILMNLIGNAIKFTDVGGVQVAVRLRDDAEPLLVVDVIDTGIGIAPENLERIFAPFVQADGSITRRFGGTGLGLSISRHLARLLGGDLRVASEPGRGSIFTVSLGTGPLDGIRRVRGPVADVMAESSRPGPQQPTALPPCRVLLVEDGVTNRKLISLVLQRAGAKVQMAENGQVGVELALAAPPDLILLDMQMPVMDGYTAARQMRERGISAPILALTAHAMKGDEAKCRAAGCSGYLSKPIDTQRLLKAVAAALDSVPPTAQDAPRATARTLGPITSTLPADDPEFREIIEEFVARLVQRMEDLRRAWERRELQGVREVAHWIKGSGGTAGFSDLTAPATRLEQSAKTGNEEAIVACIEELESLLERIASPAAA